MDFSLASLPSAIIRRVLAGSSYQLQANKVDRLRGCSLTPLALFEHFAAFLKRIYG